MATMVGLLLAASLFLLIGDLGSRKGARAAEKKMGQKKCVAVLYNVSNKILDAALAGMKEGLATKGFGPANLELEFFCSEGDMATGSAMAQQLVSNPKYDQIISLTTVSTQTVEKANRGRPTVQVFGVVSDPFASGLGLNRDKPFEHPANLVGFGTMQPVEASLQIAKHLYPDLKIIGIPWNGSEANSEISTKLARAACQKLGIEVLEAQVENTSGVQEASSSLASRGAQAIWIGGDATVTSAASAVIEEARRHRIPVVAAMSALAHQGALFGLGADYREIGKITGELSGEVLAGADVSKIEIKNIAPEELIINPSALANLRDPWTIPEDIRKRASHIVGESPAPVVDAKAAPPAPAPLSKQAKLHLVEMNEVMDLKDAERGFLDGLKEAGLQEGRDFSKRILNAQNDLVTLNTAVDTAVTERSDLIITFATPSLQAALRQADRVPVVFTYVADGVTAGAGKSDTDHHPNVTGVSTPGAYKALIEAVREVIPDVKAVGTLFNPGEINSVHLKDALAAEAKRQGVELIAVGADTQAELTDAAVALCRRPIQAIVQVPGNLTATGFPAIVQAARQSRMPLFGSMSSQTPMGAAVVVACEYYDAGKAAGLLAARVLRGEKPGDIPLQKTTGAKVLLNDEACAFFGLTIPETLRTRAKGNQ